MRHGDEPRAAFVTLGSLASDRVVERYGAEALWRALDRVELDRVVERYGAEAVWRALDRYTQPGSNEITVHEAAE